jgi:hypothetical protein
MPEQCHARCLDGNGCGAAQCLAENPPEGSLAICDFHLKGWLKAHEKE